MVPKCCLQITASALHKIREIMTSSCSAKKNVKLQCFIFFQTLIFSGSRSDLKLLPHKKDRKELADVAEAASLTEKMFEVSTDPRLHPKDALLVVPVSLHMQNGCATGVFFSVFLLYAASVPCRSPGQSPSISEVDEKTDQTFHNSAKTKRMNQITMQIN